jgi:dihydroorotase
MVFGRMLLAVSCAAAALAQTDYDLLIKGGHVIDGKNRLGAVRDVAIKDGKIAAVDANIAASRALKTVDASGLYVTPGLVDIPRPRISRPGQEFLRERLVGTPA